MKELSPQISSADKREYGIDLVKIISTFLVIMTHIFTFGGFKWNLEPFTVKYFCAVFLQGITLCCVNLFGLSTGYLYYQKKVKIHKIIQLWLSVVFLSLAVMFGYMLIKRDFSVLKPNILPSVFPLLFNTYWFFTAYLALFLFINFYNRLIERISKTEFTVLLAVFFVLFAVFPVISGRDTFVIKNGYSFVWLSVLYFCGIYIRKYDIIKKANPWICAALVAVIIFTVPLYNSFYKIHPIQIIEGGDYEIAVTSYNSIVIFVSTVLLFLLISKIKINNGVIKKLVVLLSSSSFAVYVIHTNNFIFHTFIVDKFCSFAGLSTGMLILKIFAYTLLIFVPCSVLGILQSKLFKLLKIDRLCIFIETLFKKVFFKFIREE